jgi:hypothetical protein
MLVTFERPNHPAPAGFDEGEDDGIGAVEVAAPRLISIESTEVACYFESNEADVSIVRLKGGTGSFKVKGSYADVTAKLNPTAN